MMWGGGWWLVVAVFMIFCMVMMARMMIGHGHGAHDSHEGESSGERSGRAQRILAARLARGEIDVDEYERRLSALRQPELDGTEEVRHDA